MTAPVPFEPTREAYRSLAAGASEGDRIPVTTEITVEDPYQAFRRARDDGPAVYLETTGGQPGWGYFATDPVEVMSARQPAAACDPGTSPSLAALAGRLEAENLHRGPCRVPFPCGLFGWLSYDLVREIESLPETTRDDRALPHLEFGLFDRVAAWEEPRGPEETAVTVTACPPLGSDVDASYERACSRAADLVAAIQSGAISRDSPPVAGMEATFTSDVGRDDYAERVRRIKEYVREGDTFQVNISHRLRAPATVSPAEVFAALREVNPAPYSGVMTFRDYDLVSASPELLLDVEDRELLTEPIAGTRPRGANEADDRVFHAELVEDDKERAEHAMLVDLERNDLGKVSTYGSVDVREYRRVDKYSEVMHLVSLVAGELRDDVSLAGVCRANPLESASTSPGDRLCAAIAAMFPGGTITGAPKPRTMEIIEELETTRRGPYTGSMAVLGFDQRATLNIVIRTLVRIGGEYHLRVGAGIVHDSIPEAEYEETMDKARALINAVDQALSSDASLEVGE